MILLLFILPFLLIFSSDADIRKFSQLDFEHWIDETNFLVVLFCNSIEDKLCVKERGKLKEIADEMISYKDMIFGSIVKDTDAILLSRYNVNRFPMVMLFPYTEEAKEYPLNIQVKDLKKYILETRQVVFDNRKKIVVKSSKYDKPIFLKEIDFLDMASTVRTPEKHAMLVIYDNYCGKKCAVLENVARIFQNEQDVAFYKMSMEMAEPLKSTMPFVKNPSVLWYPKDNKDRGFIYAGDITLEIMVKYINDQAGLSRDYFGNLKRDAGRVMEIDQIIRENIISILLKMNINYIIFQVEEKGKELPHKAKYVDYYISILKEIRKGFDPDKILQREQRYIEDIINKKTLKDVDKDQWRKYHNIVSAFIDFAAIKLAEDMNKRQGVLKEDVKFTTSQNYFRRDEL